MSSIYRNGILYGGGGVDPSTIAPIESTSTASKSYAVNDLFYYNGILYKVTSAIAQGDSIVTTGAGVNVEVTSVDEELKSLYPVYGITWDGSSTSEWTRTDASENFVDPQPYYAGMTGTPSSPFDTLEPWASMTKSERVGGTMVAIPKFYYKLIKSGSAMTLKIAPASNGKEWARQNGFKVSPVHMDRGDGNGERDVVYIGRYHCGDDYRSKTGVAPKVSTTRANFREGIHALGSDIWQNDYAARVTVWMLYLVEYADWNSQDKVGGGCSDSGSVMNMGYTDSMPYHTGTTASSISRTVYGGTQYRNIEGLWDNVFDWCDGIYFSAENVYVILNPANFSDTTGGTLLGTRPTSPQYISAFSIPNASGFEWAIYPSAVSGSESTYICDYCDYNASGVMLRVGGSYGQSQYRGLFYLDGSNPVSSLSASCGSRIMELPESNDSIGDKVDVLMDNGAVNHFNNTLTSQTISGVTIAVNSDGTYTLNGTATASFSTNIGFASSMIVGKSYKLTGVPSGVISGTNAYIQGYGDVAADEGDGSNPFIAVSGMLTANVKIRVEGGQVFNNTVFKIMISDAAFNLSYNDYQPYAMTNRELTETVIGEDWTRISTTHPTVAAQVYIRKIGKIVAVRITLGTTLTSSWATLCTLPTGYRPTATIYNTPYDDGTSKAFISISNDGVVQVKGQLIGNISTEILFTEA